MAFQPEFLDELRARLSLAEVIGRRVRLAKKGREWTGLCPFHNEKSPSFFVNEDKGFFHCFGCGAHGDVIGFTMRAGGLGFPEAVEALAGEAGLELPTVSPEARARAGRQQSLHAVMEAACVFYEQQLKAASGRDAMEYLTRRGLDPATIARFRLGYAPAIERGGQGRLKQALARDFPVELIEEAGLARRPDDGRDSFDYFRDRVMFPIGDRSGRVIAFGGRVMGDGQPKYLNSPETPLFHKGAVLYGLAQARAATARIGEVIVTEGYMDVIALHRAGFETAVAPLGTALTEEQLVLLWKLAAEPILCFDGDAAGQRAAARALDRALPGLQPGRSLRFAILPEGEDPDTLVRKFGAAAMRGVLDAAKPLAETLWTLESTLRPIDTPERRADLDARLADRAGQIADRRVREQYERFFKDRLYERARSGSRSAPGRGKGQAAGAAKRPPGGGFGRGRFTPGPAWGPNAPELDEATQQQQKRDFAGMERRPQEDLVAVFLCHPRLLDELVEDFATLDLPAADLDKLRRQIINLHASFPDLDSDRLKHHLIELGFARDLESLLARQTSLQTGFASSETDPETARHGWLRLRSHWLNRRHGSGDLDAAVELSDADMETAFARIQALVVQAERERLEAAESDDAEFNGG
ncbi:MAG TPA: DNA primase [Stellaceae bacterium]|nr:DNA primase [Stellaceae bacterium]